MRLDTGMYLPNPLLALLIDEEWINIYDLIDIDDIEKSHSMYGNWLIGRIKNYRKQLTEKPDMKVDPDKYWDSI